VSIEGKKIGPDAEIRRALVLMDLPTLQGSA